MVAIFDCCRESYSRLTRGGAEQAPEPDIDAESDDYRNWILFFGCPPDKGVSARSTIATDFFVQLKQNARAYDGRVVLPINLMTWSPGDDGEMIAKIKHPLQLVHDNWVSKGLPPPDYGEDGEEVK